MKVALAGISKLSKVSAIDAQTYFEFGQWCAKQGIDLLTGACGGVPYEVGKGAVSAGGRVIGFSPATDKELHVKHYDHPLDCCSEIIYYKDDDASMNSRFILRSIPMIEMADLLVSLDGSWGTMYELIIALLNGKTIVVVEESGGASQLFLNNYEELHSPAHYGETVIGVKTIEDLKDFLSDYKV